MEDVQQRAAVGAAPLLSAERFGPARQDVGDGAAMRGQHRRAMSLQIAACEAAENLRHPGHRSEAAHHPVEQPAQRGPRRFGQVGVDRRGGDVLVAEQHLDDAGVDFRLEQPGRIGMAQGVGRRPPTAGKLRRRDGVGESPAQDIGGDGTSVPAVGEQPLPVAMPGRLPHPAQALMHRARHRNHPFLVAFADHPQQAAGLVDGGDRKGGGLADPQAAGIDQAKAAAVNGIADGAENALHLGMGKRLRQPSLPGKPDLFLNSDQSTPSVCR